MPLWEQHRRTFHKQRVAEYDYNPQLIPCLSISYGGGKRSKVENAPPGDLWLLLVFAECLAALSCKLAQHTVLAWPMSGFTISWARRHRAAGQFWCVAHDLWINSIHRRRPLLRFVGATGQSMAPIYHPYPCRGCLEWIGAAGAANSSATSKKEIRRLGTHFFTMMTHQAYICWTYRGGSRHLTPQVLHINLTRMRWLRWFDHFRTYQMP